jgi:hypothetical protein
MIQELISFGPLPQPGEDQNVVNQGALTYPPTDSDYILSNEPNATTPSQSPENLPPQQTFDGLSHLLFPYSPTGQYDSNVVHSSLTDVTPFWDAAPIGFE